MARLGDSKPCGVCGGVAVLRLVWPSVATLGWVDGPPIPYDVASMPMWHCEECDDLQPLAGELDA
jgi:hypothetical protein